MTCPHRTDLSPPNTTEQTCPHRTPPPPPAVSTAPRAKARARAAGPLMTCPHRTAWLAAARQGRPEVLPDHVHLALRQVPAAAAKLPDRWRRFANTPARIPENPARNVENRPQTPQIISVKSPAISATRYTRTSSTEHTATSGSITDLAIAGVPQVSWRSAGSLQLDGLFIRKAMCILKHRPPEATRKNSSIASRCDRVHGADSARVSKGIGQSSCGSRSVPDRTT